MPAHALSTAPPANHPTDVLAFYRLQARIYDATRWLFLIDRQWAVEVLQIAEGDTVLEIGCGTGLNLPLLRAAVGPKGTVIGVDFSPEMLQRAQRKVRRRRWNNVRLMHADATQLELGCRCDLAFFSYSLTMIPDWRSALARAVRHLRPGGRLAVLDFGEFAGWGRAGQRLAAWWLRRNHVETQREYQQGLAALLDDVQVHTRRRGYIFLAIGRRREGE